MSRTLPADGGFPAEVFVKVRQIGESGEVADPLDRLLAGFRQTAFRFAGPGSEEAGPTDPERAENGFRIDAAKTGFLVLLR